MELNKQDESLSKQVDKVIQQLRSRGYNGPFNAYWQGGGRTTGELNEMLAPIVQGKAAAVEIDLHSIDPVIVTGKPYHYVFSLRYEADKGFDIYQMSVERQLKIAAVIPVQKVNDIPVIGNLPAIIKLEVPEKKPRKFRDLNKGRGRRK